MRTVALILALVAGAAVFSLLVYTARDWARSDRARAERRERQDEDESSDG
jgi:hypothetical protein